MPLQTLTHTYLWFRQGLFDSVEGLAVVSFPAQPHPHHSWVQGVYNDLGVGMQDLLSKKRQKKGVQCWSWHRKTSLRLKKKQAFHVTLEVKDLFTLLFMVLVVFDGCFFVCLWIGLWKNYWLDFHETFWKGCSMSQGRIHSNSEQFCITRDDAELFFILALGFCCGLACGPWLQRAAVVKIYWQ